MVPILDGAGLLEQERGIKYIIEYGTCARVSDMCTFSKFLYTHILHV